MGVVMSEPGYDMAEVAQIVGVNRTHAYQLVRDKKLRTYTNSTGKMKVSRFDLELYLRQREQQRRD